MGEGRFELPRQKAQPPQDCVSTSSTTRPVIIYNYINFSNKKLIRLIIIYIIEPPRGFEPPTFRLQSDCSTVELGRLKNQLKILSLKFLILASKVPGEGLEPSRCCHHRILSPACLPIPTSRLFVCARSDSNAQPTP